MTHQIRNATAVPMAAGASIRMDTADAATTTGSSKFSRARTKLSAGDLNPLSNASATATAWRCRMTHRATT